MTQETLKETFVDQIRDLYDAEKQLVKALPKLSRAATSEALSDAVNEHLEQTKRQVSRLERVFQTVNENPRSKPCAGMRGLIEEANEVIQEKNDGVELDLGLIAGAQRVEHYEISAYGTARTMAERMGNNEAANLLRQTEDEEKQADLKLTDVAQSIYDSEAEEDEQDMEIRGEGDEEFEMVTAGNRTSGQRRKSSSSTSSSGRSSSGRSTSSRGGNGKGGNGSRSSSRGRRSR